MSKCDIVKAITSCFYLHIDSYSVTVIYYSYPIAQEVCRQTMANEYSAPELEQQTGLSIRNIRYYTDLGLLPPPILRGKNACYTSDHLQRIRLIQRLRERHFPLSEIKQILEQQDEAGVEKLLEAQEKLQEQLLTPFPMPDAADQETDAGKWAQHKALAYIDSLMGKPEPAAQPALIKVPQFKVQELNEGISGNNLDSIRNVQQLLRDEGETWERISLAPGVELHLRQPVSEADRAAMHKLVEAARKIFRKRSK
jgi:DNA-binding transcriptional MerR regulator